LIGFSRIIALTLAVAVHRFGQLLERRPPGGILACRGTCIGEILLGVEICLGHSELLEALLRVFLSFASQTLRIERFSGIASKCIKGCAFMGCYCESAKIP
jgi:hypothetical protein